MSKRMPYPMPKNTPPKMKAPIARLSPAAAAKIRVKADRIMGNQ